MAQGQMPHLVKKGGYDVCTLCTKIHTDEETGEEMALTPRAEEEQVTPRSLQQKQE